MNKNPKKVYIVHDYQSNANDHWYPWLSLQIKALGHSAKRVMLAQPHEPNLSVWQENLKLQIPVLDADTILIAHGLSCLSILQFIEHHYVKSEKAIADVILVAGFDQPLTAWSELSNSIGSTKLSYTQLQYNAARYVMFMSNDDPIVPAPFSLRLAHGLNANIVEIKQAGHFTKHAGFNEFPQLLAKLQPSLANDLQSVVNL